MCLFSLYWEQQLACVLSVTLTVKGRPLKDRPLNERPLKDRPLPLHIFPLHTAVCTWQWPKHCAEKKHAHKHKHAVQVLCCVCADNKLTLITTVVTQYCNAHKPATCFGIKFNALLTRRYGNATKRDKTLWVIKHGRRYQSKNSVFFLAFSGTKLN